MMVCHHMSDAEQANESGAAKPKGAGMLCEAVTLGAIEATTIAAANAVTTVLPVPVVGATYRIHDPDFSLLVAVRVERVHLFSETMTSRTWKQENITAPPRA